MHKMFQKNCSHLLFKYWPPFFFNVKRWLFIHMNSSFPKHKNMLGNEKFFHFVDELFVFKNLLVGHHGPKKRREEKKNIMFKWMVNDQ